MGCESVIQRCRIGQERGQVRGGEGHHAFVFAPVEMNLLKYGPCVNAPCMIIEALHGLQCASACQKGVVQFADQRVGDRLKAVDLPLPVIVLQPFSEAIGLVQAQKRLRDFTQLDQGLWQLKVNVQGLHQS